MITLRHGRVCFAIFLGCVAANLWFSAAGWRHNLLELHEFRQLQTALTTRAMLREGWHLAYPTPLFGPPWSAPMEFPLYQICVARTTALTGWPLEPVGRLVSLVFFYLALPALYLLLRTLNVAAPRRWLFLGLLLVTPVYLYYSRAFMIESAAFVTAIWFLYACIRACETGRAPWMAAAIALGTLAALAKITTFVVFALPALAFVFWSAWQVRPPATGTWRRSLVVGARGGVILGSALAAGAAWVEFGDRVKAANPLSRFLLSTALREWNFGSLSQRFSSAAWTALADHTTTAVATLVTLGILGFSFVVMTRTQRIGAAALLGCYLAATLVFTNLFVVHDYYFYANGIFLVTAVALGWCALLDSPRLPGLVKWTLIAVSLAAQVFSYTHSYFTVQTRPDVAPPEICVALARATEPSDVLLLVGFQWNPRIPYLSDRKSIMVTDENVADEAALDQVLQRLPRDAIGALAVSDYFRRDATLLRRLTTKLGFSAEPVLQNSDTVVFVAPRLLAHAVAQLEPLGLSTFTLNAPPDTEYHGIKQRRYRVADLPDPSVTAMFSPRPQMIVAPYGISTTDAGGLRVFNAHAPTEISFEVRSPHRLRADFGMLPGAYAGEHKSDGVEFEIESVDASGRPTVVFHRRLDPARTPADRARQHIDLALSPNAGSRIVLRTLPGPADNTAFDWAYWSAVEIE